MLSSVLRGLLDRSLCTAGGVRYTDEEPVFIQKVRTTPGSRAMSPIDSAAQVLLPKPSLSSVSTEVGDVSWLVPVGHFTPAAMRPACRCTQGSRRRTPGLRSVA